MNKVVLSSSPNYSSVLNTPFKVKKQSTMELKRYKYSPLFRIRKLLLLNKCFFGFPFKSVTEEFNTFEFNPWIEYTKLLLFNILEALGMCYIGYITMKGTDIWHPYDAFLYKTGKFGLSGLDMAVMLGYPFVCIISNSVCFIQLRNEKSGLNKICRLLTHINEELDGVWKGSKLGYDSRLKSVRKNLCVMSIIISLTCLTMSASWIAITLSGSTENLSKAVMITGGISIVLQNTFLLLPPMCYGAEMTFTQLVFETKEICIKLKDVLKSKTPLRNGMKMIKGNTNDGHEDINEIVAAFTYEVFKIIVTSSEIRI